MKKVTIILTGVILMTIGTLSVKAQSTATASTTATLVTPISIDKTTDMNFGVLAASDMAGTVELDYSNGRNSTGGVTLPGGSVDQKTAVFTVTGEANSSFSISIPESPIVMTGNSAGMTVSDFECEQGAATTLTNGTAVLKIKAILNVPAKAIAGVYSNASGLFVTVNYN